MAKINACQCGWNGEGEHPCHWGGYTCGKPASARFVTRPTCLAGMQMKVEGYQTFACDEHWELFNRDKEKEKSRK